MDCVGQETFGCQMDSIGGWFQSFFSTAGDPLASFLFVLLMIASIVILFTVAGRAINSTV